MCNFLAGCSIGALLSLKLSYNPMDTSNTPQDANAYQFEDAELETQTPVKKTQRVKKSGPKTGDKTDENGSKILKRVKKKMDVKR